VRLAGALVAGQALLCAVIGWLTFGPPDAAEETAAPVQPVAAPPPLVIPSITVALPPTPPPSTRATTEEPPNPPPRARSSRSPRQPVAPKPAGRQVDTGEPGTPVVAPPVEPAPAPSPDVNATPTPSESAEVQGPVVAGEPCEPEGAPGVTDDEVALRCVRADDGQLRWEIN
jgi:hypothetical protein